MATDFDPSARDADDALRMLHTDRQRLAQRIRSPWWYYPVVAALAAAVAIAPGLSDETGGAVWTTSIIAVAVILIAVLPMLARRDGVSPLTRPLSRKALLLLASQVGLLVVLMLASGMVSKLAAHGAWLILIAIVAFAGMWMLGRLYDRAQLVAMNGQTPSNEA